MPAATRRRHLLLQCAILSLCLQGGLISARDADEAPKALKPCTAYNAATGSSYDLNTLTVTPLENHKKVHKEDRSESWHARGYDYGANFTMNFCAPVVEDLAKEHVVGIKDNLVKNISAFYKMGDKTYSIGQLNMEPIYRGKKLVLNYTDGSPCDHESSKAAKRKFTPKSKPSANGTQAGLDSKDSDHHISKTSTRRKSTIIAFHCDRDSLSKVHISFVGSSPDECSYFFEARALAACGGVIATQRSISPGGIFGVIALITAAVYVLGGVAYQRTVMHQRGWRQLPNYSLWAGIFGFTSDLLVILTSSCLRFMPRRKGYSQLPGRTRRDDEANGLIDSYDEDY